MSTYRSAILERYDAVVTGGASTRAQMLTINIKNINGLFNEDFSKQARMTFGYVMERLQRLLFLDSFLISPGITEKGNVHYHVLLVMTNSFKIIRPVRSLFNKFASIHWSDPCNNKDDVKSCINYIIEKNAKPAAKEMKVKIEDIITYYQNLLPRAAPIRPPPKEGRGLGGSPPSFDSRGQELALACEGMNEQEYDMYWGISKKRKKLSLV